MKYLIIFCTFAIIVCHNVNAQPGSVDSSFGINGISVTNNGISEIGVEDIAIDKQGRIYGVTRKDDITDDVLVYRTLKDGSIDKSFGDNGRVVIMDWAFARNVYINLFSDGKVLVSVIGSSLNQIRMLENGDLDSSFGINGFSSYNYIDASFELNDCYIQKDDKILYAGSRFIEQSKSKLFLVFRFNINGLLDSSFADDGIFQPPAYAFPYEIGRAIRQTDEGNIVIGADGGIWVGSLYYMAIRLTPNGGIDRSFGTNGYAAKFAEGFCNDAWTCSEIRCMAVDKKGRILVGGDLETGDIYFRTGVIRYTPEGKVDSTFATNGIFEYRPPGSSSGYLNEILHDSYGNTILCCRSEKFRGSPQENDSVGSLVIRLTERGMLDPSFNKIGYNFDLVYRGTRKLYNCAAMQENNKIVVGGGELVSAGFYTMLVQYNGTKTIRSKIIGWIRQNILNFTDANGNATQYNIEQQNSGGGFSTIASVLPNTNNSYSYDISNNTSTTTNNNFRIKAVYADGSIVYSDVVTQAALQTSIKPSIYPNPASTVVTINGLNKNKNYNIIISNKEAQPLLQTASKSVTQKQIDIAMLKPGIYFIELKDDAGVVVRLKLVKE